MLDDLLRLQNEYAARSLRLVESNLYSLFNPWFLFLFQQRQRATLKLLKEYRYSSLEECAILEVGCGKGNVLIEYLSYGAKPSFVHGCDLLIERLQAAHRRLPFLQTVCADGQNLPYPEKSFHLVLQYVVFSSILDEKIKTTLANEILRVLKPNGLIIWYDFWLNPFNRQTRGIRPNEIRRLFPGCGYKFHRITLAPPITRFLIHFSWSACALLENLKVFNTHYLVAIQKEQGQV